MTASRKPQTLRNSLQFRRVYDQGKRFHTPYFSAFILKNDSGEQRYGITATRKIGGAVIRNRCKRRLKEVIRKYRASDPSQAGFDLVLNVKSGLNEVDFTRLESAFSQVMKKFLETAVVRGD
jgi:ribonuclease P protein component